LQGDPKHRVVEPTLAQIEAALRAHGHAGEAELWRGELARVAADAARSSPQ
jgi:hypothetical protein